MFDIGWTELLVIGVVALIVVGPKDLPGMFRTLGRFTGKMKAMAREFQRAMDDAADQSGMRDVAKDLRGATSSKNLGLDKLNKAADSFEKWKPGAPKTGDAARKAEETLKARNAEAAPAAPTPEADPLPAPDQPPAFDQAGPEQPAPGQTGPEQPAKDTA